MRLLILADNYYPLPLANGICVKSLVESIERYGHQCTVINRMDDGTEVEDTDSIHSFNCSRHPNYKFPKKTLYKIWQLFIYPHIYKRLVDSYYKQLLMENLQHVDVILSVCNPIESVLAALKVKKAYPAIRQIVYNVDTLSDFRIRWIEGVCCPLWQQKAFKVEKDIFEKADVVSILCSHKGYYSSGKYAMFEKKFLFQEVPLLKVSGKGSEGNNGRSIYAGRFYKDFREPSILLNLFRNTSLGLDIYTTSNYYKSIRESTSASDNITVNEYIPEEELNKVMMSSKILVSIGNKSSNMFPSKTVTYVAMCKPIIHIFHDNIDPVVDYLRNYPDVLFVDLRNSLAKNRSLVFDFCNRQHQPINPTLIEERYKTSTPEYCACELLNRINQI